MKITVQNFTGIYEYQPFMQELRQSATNKFTNSTDICWLDCTKIIGTDCYCDDEAVKEINELIDNAGTAPGIHFFDNGNYHYMSKLWTDKIQEPFSLVVFDHHPDMQPPRFGGILSCGGWVLEVLKTNKFVQNVIIIGVKDELVETIRKELSQSGEDKILDKVTFIKESKLNSTLHLLSISDLKVRDSGRPHTSYPIYLSIDKDALAPAYAATNWDQGSLSTESLKAIIAKLAAEHKVLGVDICGERSHDFEGNEYHTVQEADALNNALNQELVKFLQNL